MLISSAAIARPNVVVVLTDDQDGTGSISHMPKVLSLLAEQGVTFTNSFVNESLCAPSRASLLTGQAAHNHGISENEGAWQQFRLLERNALPVWLQAEGYRTAFFGKYINRYGETAPIKPSWIESLVHRFGWSSEAQPKVDLRTTVPPGWNFWFANTGGSYR